MRIAMIGPFGLHPKQTMRSRALGLARPLAARGHEVCLFMPPWDTPAEADRAWVEDGVALRYVPLSGGALAIGRRLAREALAWQPEAIHCFKPKGYSGLAAEWLWRFHRGRARLVVDTDDWEGAGGWNDIGDYTPLQKRFFARQERWGLTHNHAVTAASRTLESLVWSLGAPPAQVHYLPNGPGIPIEAVTPQQRAAARERLGLGERPSVLVYSRLFEFDTERLANVLAGIRAAVPDMAILLVGAGLREADGARFREQLAGRDLLQAVIDAGWTALEQLPATLAAADVGLYLMDDNLLNRAKCPVKLVDMLVAGVPVVAEAVGQVVEYVGDGRGALRPTGDEAGLAAAAVELLQNRERRERMGAAAREEALARFSWSRLASIAEQVYAG